VAEERNGTPGAGVKQEADHLGVVADHSPLRLPLYCWRVEAYSDIGHYSGSRSEACGG
jgi:hypothetical protein